MKALLRCPCGHEVELAEGAEPPAVCPACGRRLGDPLPDAPQAEQGPAGEAAPQEGQSVPAPRRCPFCCEPIQPSARKCPHCQEYLDPALARQARALPRRSPFAVAAFILALISPFFLCFPGPIAAVLGIAALLDRKATEGRGMAYTGLILGILCTVALTVLVLLVLAGLAEVARHPAPSSPTEPLF